MFPRKIKSASKSNINSLVGMMAPTGTDIILEQPQVELNEIGEYGTDVNLEHIHNYIKQLLTSKKPQLDKITQQINNIEEQLKKQMFKCERHALDKQLLALKKEESNLQSNILYDEYYQRAKPYLDAWKELQRNRVIRLGQKEVFSPDRLAIIQSYFQILVDYTDIMNNPMLLKLSNVDNICPYCSSEFVVEDDTLLVCYNCDNYQTRLLFNGITFDDVSRVNNVNNNYSNKEVFIRVMDCYECRQTPDWVLSDVITNVENYCCANQQNPKALKPQDILKVFKKLGYNNYYNDFILFAHLYNGWSKPTLDEYRPYLEQDYDAFYQMYENIKDTIKEDERSSAQNSWYFFYKLVQRRNIPYIKDNFKYPETTDTLIKADNTTRQVFKALEEQREEGEHPWIFSDTV